MENRERLSLVVESKPELEPEPFAAIIERLKLKNQDRLSLKRTQDEATPPDKIEAQRDKAKADPSYSSALPVEMTRLNPFFIMEKRQMSNRVYKKVTFVNSFGQITIQGERLSVFDETVFLAVLKLVIDRQSSEVTTTRYELLTLIGVNKSGPNYQSLWEALKRLGRTQIAIENYAKSANGERRLSTGFFNSLIASGNYSDGGNRIVIKLDPYFLSLYSRNLMTFVDMNFRKCLKGDVAKALYRFYQGQSLKKYSIGIEKLCRAINFEKKGAYKETRRILRDAHNELQRRNYLQHWGMKEEVISIVKAQLS